MKQREAIQGFIDALKEIWVYREEATPFYNYILRDQSNNQGQKYDGSILYIVYNDPTYGSVERLNKLQFLTSEDLFESSAPNKQGVNYKAVIQKMPITLYFASSVEIGNPDIATYETSVDKLINILFAIHIPNFVSILTEKGIAFAGSSEIMLINTSDGASNVVLGAYVNIDLMYTAEQKYLFDKISNINLNVTPIEGS